MERVHPVTWLLIVAGVINLLADIAEFKGLLDAVRLVGALDAEGGAAYAPAIQAWFRNIAWSMSIFGTAAMVEYLVRIWRELRQARLERAQPPG